MPNHITNLITFGSDSASLSAFQRMAHDMKMDGEPLGSFDFNKLIPMPQSLDMEESTMSRRGLELYQKYTRERDSLIRANVNASPEQLKVLTDILDKAWRPRKMQDPTTWKLGEQAYSNLQKYGHASWYSWCNQNWGTKWNAYQSRPLQDGDDTMEFLTAWGAVPVIMLKLSEKYPEQTITYRWADEDIGHNVGEMVFRNGECIEEFVPEGGSRAAYEMAAEIMGTDLASFGLYLNKDKTGYEYRDEPPVETKPPTKKPKWKEQTR
jgi:hypothetical protein